MPTANGGSLSVSTSTLANDGRDNCVLALVHDNTGSVLAHEQLQQRNRELETIASTIKAATADLNLQAILDHCLAGALDLTGLEGGTLCLVDPRDRSLILSAARNASQEMIDDLAGKRVQIGQCLCGNAAETGEPLILWDNASGSEFATFESVRNEGIRFHAAFPLQVRGQVTGVLCIFARSAAQPDDRSLRLVKDLCNSIALTIENARLFESAQRELMERRKAELALRGEYAFRNAVIQHAAEGLCVFYALVEKSLHSLHRLERSHGGDHGLFPGGNQPAGLVRRHVSRSLRRGTRHGPHRANARRQPPAWRMRGNRPCRRKEKGAAHHDIVRTQFGVAWHTSWPSWKM